jgi:hypothetical protein
MENTTVKRHWAHHIKAPGKHLPKRLLRPFALPGYHRLDEKQLVLVAEGDKRNWVNMLRGFAYVFAAGGGLHGLHFISKNQLRYLWPLLLLLLASCSSSSKI